MGESRWLNIKVRSLTSDNRVAAARTHLSKTAKGGAPGNAETLIRPSYFRISQLLPHEPSPRPAMNVDSTMETSGLVTPNSAIANRSHTSS